MSSRNTRARSRASAGSSAPNSRQATYSEPPSADLPSLYPMHDGSYGVNTHVNLDNVRRRRGRKPRSSLVSEEDDDRRFTRRIKGRDGKRFDMENDLQKVVEETVEEAQNYQDPDEQDDIWLDPSLHPEDRQPGLPAGTYQADPPNNPDQNPPDISVIPEDDEYSEIENNDYPKQAPGRIPRLGGQSFWPDSDYIRTPPHDVTRYRSADPDSLIYNRQPSVPPTTVTPFFGGSTGSGYAFRPSSSKSFMGEGTLYGDANVITPQSKGSSAPAANYSSGLGSSPGTGQPTSSEKLSWPEQPASLEKPPPTKPPPTQPTSGQSISKPTSPKKPTGNSSQGLTTTGKDNSNTTSYTGASDPYHLFDTGAGFDPNSGGNDPFHPFDTSIGLESTGISDSTLTGLSENTKSNDLSSEEWKIVTDFIQGMRRPPQQRSTSVPLGPAKPLDHLTPVEIQATSALIRDMGKDAVTVLKAIDELDRVANLAGPPKSNTIRLFADKQPPAQPPTQPPTQPPVAPFNPPSLFNPDSTGAIGQGAAPLGEVDDADDEDGEYESAQRAARSSRNKPGAGTNSQLTNKPQSSRPSRRRRNSWTRWFVEKWDAILVFLTILAGVWVLLTFISRSHISLGDYTPNKPEVQWPTWDTVKGSVIQAIPSGMRNPMGKIRDFTTPSTASSDRGFGTGRSGDTPSKVAEAITSQIPEKVFVEVDKKGKLTISQDFWHALRDLIKEDDIILTLEEARKNAPDISDAHWLAIKNRLAKSDLVLGSANNTGLGPNPVDPSTTGRTGRGGRWDRWVRKNEETTEQARPGGVLVSRDEFMDMFKKSMQSYQQEVRKAYAAQNERIQEIVDDMVKLRDEAKDTPAGLTKGEIKTIVDAAINKAIRNAKLGSMADGQIHGFTNDLFANQVNFFGVGSGAVIDPKYTSKPWEIPKGYFEFRSKQWYQRDGWRPQPPLQALAPWSEEGECYCAGPSAWGQTQEVSAISVILSREIIPQNLVVEHILPGSTLDPGAMPKDIEVWVYIEELTLRDEVRTFSEINFPTTEPEKTLHEGFVKIGHFEYEKKTTGDGVQVFKLSDDLTLMHAHASTIVVRAISNYGADHTCFYRLRLYGEVVETKPWEEWNGRDE
ncbi:hypothetical protein F4781DRAFT_86917 [Annulohypoxylon bovei var. microspora]|nr:hypothetical protein F4781DRAFT_86917 [Annulohypoxylon bovei var. microspora]